MTNPELVAFCRQTRDHTERIKDLVSVSTELPASLRESLAMLEDRTARPEVRILVLGPLKSGKSTFMNVIARNPRVSQVSPRPAYPCVVEISDLGDDPAEVSIFYKGGVAQAAMPLEQGMERLNALLEDYVQAKSDEEPQYERVVQKVRLNVAKGQLGLVLIDSPGLLFGGTHYSEKTQDMIKGADILVFVIRPEQLFFDAVKVYLSSLVQHAEHRRVFIIVNASTQAKNLTNGKFEVYNQLDAEDELKKYFNRRIATDQLLAALQRETHFTIHFTDLCVKGQARFETESLQDAAKSPPEEATEAAPGTEGVRAIEYFIEHNDLVGIKERNLRSLVQQTVRNGIVFLNDLTDRKQGEIKNTRQEHDVLTTQIAKHTEEKNRLSSEKAQAGQTLGNLKKQLEHLSSQEIWTAGSQFKDDELWQELPQIEAHCRDQKAEPMVKDDELKRLVQKLFDKWKDGGFGTRSLANLADAVWSQRVQDRTQSFREEYEAALQAASNNLVVNLRNPLAENSAWRQILLHPGLTQPFKAPLWPAEPPPLLQFPRVKSFWGGHWIGYVAEDLWGPDGRKQVEDGFEKDILNQHYDLFIGGILHDPWNLANRLSGQEVGGSIRAEFGGRLRVAVVDHLTKRRGDVEGQIRTCETKEQELIATLARLEGERQALTETITRLEAQHADLNQRVERLKSEFEP